VPGPRQGAGRKFSTGNAGLRAEWSPPQRRQAPADQCPASKLVIKGWNAFYAERKDISDLLDKSAQNKHKALCKD
jgi:hypothetical protein